MLSGKLQSPGDGYPANLTQQSMGNAFDSTSPPEQSRNNVDGGHNGVPRPKRIACVICRKRKLRCDGGKPSCGTCTRLAHDCSYDEVRRKSGPKRGYVKQLEARLAQVETLLKTQDPADHTSDNPTADRVSPGQGTTAGRAVLQNSSIDLDFTMGDQDAIADILDSSNPFNAAASQSNLETMYPQDQFGLGADDQFSWELIGQGLEEPLPSQEVINELHQTYFEKIHPSVPMLHRPRYLAGMNLAPNLRPPICLRYAIWSLAASVMEKYPNIKEHFYERARKYAESDEMKGHGESFITVAHSQAWTLIATYEFKHMYFPRAWMSAGRAIRLAQMLGLHRLDGVGLDVKQCLPPPRDWTEREERRRAFWMTFCVDRYASIGTGWPVLIDEKDILTSLPATEEAYLNSKPQRTLSLVESMNPEGAANLAPFAGVCLMACLFGRNLTHLHRPDPNDRDDDLNGEFWKRQRQLDNILLNISLSLPSHLRLPAGLANANIVFLNMNIHTSTICLHQAAIFKADKNRLPPSIASESKTRCILAAAEIAGIMRMVSHLDVATMNPFSAFCLYVAARVFVQYLKSRPEDQSVRASLDFLLGAMRALKRTNPLAESFLVQLDVDLGGNGTAEDLNFNARFSAAAKQSAAKVPGHIDSPSCSVIYEIRQFNPSEVTSQSPNDSTLRCPPLQTTNGLPMDFNSVTNLQYRGPYVLPNRQKSSRENSTVNPLQPQGVASNHIYGGNMVNGSPIHTMDVEVASNNGSSENHSSSNHPTPSTTSNKSSSCTSYSPPQLDEMSATQYLSNIASISSPNTSAFFDSNNTFGGYSPGSQPVLATMPEQEIDGSFVVPSDWDFQSGRTGLTPDSRIELPPSLQAGMNSLDGSGWANMLDDYGWGPLAGVPDPLARDTESHPARLS